MADHIGAIARKLLKDDPTLSQEVAWSRAHEMHAKEVTEANAIRAKVIDLVKANPAILGGPVTLRTRPLDIGAALESERVRLMREGRTLDEAVREASANVQARIDAWRATQLREATANGATIVANAPAPPKAAAPKAAPKAQPFVPVGMSPIEAAQAAASGRLPTRTEVAIAGARHLRLMRRVAELQAEGETYDAAFLTAIHEVDAAAPAAKGGAK